jgi:mono/diheme cytochrome c family protein
MTSTRKAITILAAVFTLSGLGSARAEPVSRGAYLAAIMDCGGCHTPGVFLGRPDAARPLAGSEVGFQIPGFGIFWPPNLTPDKETGLGTWSEDEIIAAVRTGQRPDGRLLSPAMPWRSYSALSDADALALARYLKSLPPVSNKVAGPAGPSEKAPGPYLTVAMP